MAEMMKKQFEVKQLESTEDGVNRILISTASVDRDGDRVLPEGIIVENYLKNPVVMWLHDYYGRTPAAGIPIGQTKALEKAPDGQGIIAEFEFLPGDEFAQRVKNAWDQGFIRTASIGFIPREAEENEFGGQDFRKWELLEWSLVPIPANQEALRLAVKALGIEGVLPEVEAEKKGVIPYRATPKAPEDTPWDGPREIREADIDDLRVMCAWYDSENPDVKSSYKLPHHRASDHYVVWNGVRAAMGALLGARGGVNIPDRDRKGVYNHLSKHYRQFEKEPPEFRSYSAEELVKLFPDLADEKPITDDIEPRMNDLLRELEEIIENMKRLYMEE